MPPSFEWRIFAVDDGSTDDTAAALAEFGDRVDVICGSGTLFWAGGMRAAEHQAVAWNPDLYLWYNDDSVLDAAHVCKLIESAAVAVERRVVYVGSLCDDVGTLLYGPLTGVARNPLGFVLAGPGDTIATFNGNFVLVPRSVVELVGGVPRGYRHGYADLVYGVRCRRAGVEIEPWAGPVGVGTSNPNKGKMFSAKLSLSERIRRCLSPFGLPLVDHFRYCRELTGVRAIYWFTRSYYRVVWPSR
jgi:GT2 family glycosyltransferase